MASKSEIKKSDFLKLVASSGDISAVISPNQFQVGLDDPDFKSSAIFKGSVGIESNLVVSNGITGSITQVSDGVDFIQAGSGIDIKKNSNGSISIAAIGFSPNSLTIGNGLSPNGGVYNGSSTVSLNVTPVANQGISATSAGVGISFSNLTHLVAASLTTGDRVLVEDITTSTPMFTTINEILSLGSAGTLANAITVGAGLSPNGAAYNNTAPISLSVATKTNGALAITSNELHVDVNAAQTLASVDAANDLLLIYDADTATTKKISVQNVNAVLTPGALTFGAGLSPNGSTYDGSGAVSVSVQAADSTITSTNSGIQVNSVPNTLIPSDGIQPFAFNGSAAASIAINRNTSGGLNFDSSSPKMLQLDVNNLVAGPTPTLSDEIAVAFASNDTRKVDIGAVRDVILNNHPANTVWVDGGLKAKTTSSISIDSSDRFTDGIGMDDAFFFVSGSINSRGTTTRGTSVFGGDVFASGSAVFPMLSGSLTKLADGTSYLIAGANVTITSESNGSITIASTGGGGGGGSSTFQSGSTSVGSVTTVDVEKLGVLQSLGGGVIAITGSIGLAEDGSYNDGLFTDFKTTTPIGTAVDRFNEVLKGLAPSAAPVLDDIDSADSGTAAKLSFGSTQAITSYTNVQPSTLTPTNNLPDVDINGAYSSTITSNDARIACFAGSTIINGTLNADIPADGSNYAQYSFGSADQGELKLYVNDNTTPVHTVDLSSFGSGDSLNGNSSGFKDLSATTPGHFADGSNFDTFQHRTGSYQIVPAEQRNGWNWARVVHTIGSSDTTTNYVEWVNDPDANALASAGSVLDTLAMTGERKLSGARYHTGGTAEYRVRATNAYKNVYSTSNITFGGSNCSVSSQAFPAIDHAGGEDENKVLHITGSASINADPILDGSITVNVNVPHPLKSNLSSAGAQSISGILLYNLSNTSTTTSETFRSENYRLSSGSYNAQADVTDSSNSWDSAKHMSGSNAGHADGLLFYNSALRAPAQGVASGDFRNTADGGSITNGPANNVDYSGITSGMRTFYRYFQNTSGGSKSNFSLAINGSGTIVSQDTGLNASNIHVLLKIPTTSAAFSTGWMDLAVPFATLQNQDGAGCLDGSLDSSLNATNNGTFGTQSVGANEYVMVKVEADASWTGNISQMSITWT